MNGFGANQVADAIVSRERTLTDPSGPVAFVLHWHARMSAGYTGQAWRLLTPELRRATAHDFLASLGLEVGPGLDALSGLDLVHKLAGEMLAGMLAWWRSTPVGRDWPQVGWATSPRPLDVEHEVVLLTDATWSRPSGWVGDEPSHVPEGVDLGHVHPFIVRRTADGWLLASVTHELPERIESWRK